MIGIGTKSDIKWEKVFHEKVKYCIVLLRLEIFIQIDLIATLMSPYNDSLLSISKISEADSSWFYKSRVLGGRQYR